MSDNVDKRVVEMEFRNGDFERNANQSINTLNKLDKSLNINGDGAAKSLKGISAAMAALPIPGLANSIETVNAKFSAMQVMATTALANITNSAVNAGRRIVSALTIDPIHSGLSEYELKMDSTRVIMSSTGESIETVNKYLEELNEYSDRTIYSFADMTNNIGKFTNAGVKLEDAVMAIKGISNEAAVSGASANEASRAMYNFAQALSQGSVKLIDWKSIENANMATMEFKQQLIDTAVEMGTLTKQGDKYVTTTVDLTGKVSEAFNSTQMFNESLSHQWMTTDVLVKTLGKYADETTEIGKKSYEAAEEVTTLSKMVDTLKETAQSGWSRTWEIIFGDIETAKKLFTPLTNTISGIIQAYDDFRNNLLEGALSKSPLGQLSEKLSNLKGDTADAGKAAEGTAKSLAEMQDVVNRVWRGDYGVMQERWNLLDSEGYDSKVVQSLVNLGYQYSLSVDDVNAAYKKFGKAAPAIIKATDGLKSSVEDLNDEQLKNAGLTEDEIKQYRELQKQSKETGKSIGELISNMDGLSGRELLIGGLKNMGESLMNTFKALKDAWFDAFPPPTSTQLYNLIDGFNKFTERIKITEEKAAKLERIFKGVFAIIDLVATVIGGPLKIAFKIITKVLSYFNLDILGVVAVVADAIVAFRDWVESLIDFDAVAEGIGKTIDYVANAVKTWWDGFNNAPNKFQYVVDSMNTIVSGVATAISKWFDNLKNGDTIVGYIIQGFCNGFMDGTKAVLDTVKNFVNSIVDTVKNLLGIHSPSTVFFDIGKNVIEGLFNGLSWFVGTVTDFARDSVKDIVGIFDSVPWDTIFMGAGLTSTIVVARRLSKAAEAFVSPLKSLSNCINTLNSTISTLGNSLKSYIKAKKMTEYGKAFKSFATGIILIAGALWIMSGIDADSLQRSITALSAMGALIIVMAFVFSKMQGIKPLSVLGVIVGLSLLLTKLAMVLVMCALLPAEKAKQGIHAVAALTLLLILLTGMMKLFSVKQAYVGSKLMTSIAKVLTAMVVVMRLCGTMRDDQFEKGMTAVIVFSGLIALLMLCTKLVTSRDVAKAMGAFGSIGICLVLMAVACKIAGSMSMDDATVGIVVMTAMTVLIILLMAATRLLGGGETKIGRTMLALSAALLIMALTVKIAGNMKEEEVKNGLTVMAALVAFVTLLLVVVKIFGSDKKCGTTVLALAVAIGVLAIVCVLMGQMDANRMGKGLAAIGVLSIFMSILLKSARGVEKCASTVIAIAVCVAILATVAAVLGLLPGEQLAKGVAALDAMLIGLAIVFANCKRISKNKGTVIAVTAAIVALAGCVWLLSTIEGEAAIRSTACMVVLLTDFAICMKIVKKVDKKAIAGIATVTLVAAALAGLIILLSQCANPDTAIQVTACLAGLLTDLTLCTAILSKCKKVNKKALVGLASMTLVTAGLAAILWALDELDVDVNIKTVASLVVLLEGLVGAVAIMSKINTANISLKGTGKVMLVIAEIIGTMTAIIAAMGAVSEAIDAGFGDGTTSNVMDKGIEMMGDLGAAIGAFIGNILGGLVGGIGDGIAKSLPSIGESLSAFMDNCQGFFDGVNSMPPGSTEAVNDLAACILVITGADLINSFMGMLGSGNAMADFSSGIGELGTALQNFSNSVKGLSDDDVKQAEVCSKVCATLAEMSAHLPRQGGLWGDIFGNNSLEEWAPGLTVLGTNLVSFASSINTLTDADLDHMESASSTVEVIAEMAKKIPNEGGLWASIFGDNALSQWAPQLPILGENLMAFANSISGITDADAKNMESMTDVAAGLADMAKAIPNEGLSLASIFVGDNSLAMWAPELETLGINLQRFCYSTRGILSGDQTRMTTLTSVTQGIVDISNQIPNEGGMVSWFTGDNSIEKWAEKLPEFGESIKNYAIAVRGIGDTTDADKATAVAAALVDGTKDLPSTGGLGALFGGDQDLSKWGKQLPEFGEGVKGFAEKVRGIKEVENLETIAGIAKTLSGIMTEAPNMDGFIQMITGQPNISAVGNSFGCLAEGLRAFALTVNGDMDVIHIADSKAAAASKKSIDFTSDNMKSAVSIVETLSTIYGLLMKDNMFDAIANLISAGNFANFVLSLESLGDGLGKFVVSYFATGAGAYSGQSDKVDQIGSVVDCVKEVTSVVTDSINSNKLFSASSVLTDFTSSVSHFFHEIEDVLGDTDTQFINRVATAGRVINSWIKDFETSKASMCADSIEKLVGATNDFKAIKIEDVDSFVQAINKLSTLGTGDINAGTFDELYKGMKDIGVKMVNSIASGIKINWTALRNGITSAMKTSREKMSTAISGFKTMGKTLIAQMGTGASTNWSILNMGVTSALTQVKIQVNKTYYDVFKTLGVQLMQGFSDGMTSKADDVTSAASKIAQSAVDATRKTLDVHSPSRVLYSVGEYTAMGFINGLNDYRAASFYAGESMSQSAVDGMTQCLDLVQSLIDDEDLDWSPTISPVLDLTGIQNGAKQIDGILSSGAKTSASIASSISVSSGADRGGMTNADVVNAISGLASKIDALPHNTYNVNGVTYDDGSNISTAVNQLLDAIQLKRRT